MQTVTISRVTLQEGIALPNVREEILAANAAYAAEFGDKGNLPSPPARQIAILTCMDARMDPTRYAGLAEGDAHVIRNAGGRATDDAIRSLIISYKLLGTREWFVIHHTKCGMLSFTNETMRDLLARSLKPATFDGSCWHDSGEGQGSMEGEFINFLPIRDLQESLVNDIRHIRAHPLVPRYIPIYGYIYDVSTGRLIEVPEATRVGAATQTD